MTFRRTKGEPKPTKPKPAIRVETPPKPAGAPSPLCTTSLPPITLVPKLKL